MALLSVTNDKGFQNLLQTNVLYFLLKPFQKKNEGVDINTSTEVKFTKQQ